MFDMVINSRMFLNLPDDITYIICSYTLTSIPKTPIWLYKMMSLTTKNPYRPQAWNRYLTNNYDIKNLIFSYVPNYHPSRKPRKKLFLPSYAIMRQLGGKKGLIRNFQMAHRALVGSRITVSIGYFHPSAAGLICATNN